MNLLLFTPQLPYPPHQGTTIRNFNLIAHLARHHTIDLITFLAPGQTLTAANPLHHYCAQILTVPQPTRSLAQRAKAALTTPLPDMALRLESAAMHALVQRLDRPYDLIQVEGIEMAQYGRQARAQQRARGSQPRLLFDDHNCEYLLQKRNALTDLRNPRRWIAGLYSLIQWAKLRRYEAAICRAADLVTAVSEPDQRALETLVRGRKVTVVANGITPADYTPINQTAPPLAHSGRLNLVFTGKMDYRPNIDAALWFGEQVLPLIQAQEPTVHFQIVGMNPHPRLAPLRSNPAIEITGAVEQISPYLAGAAVYVVPLRVGGGTRFKVLEAMAQGLPLVSTPLGVEGIGVTDEQELLLASTPETFAAAVLRLLADHKQGGGYGATLGRQARAFVEAEYSWDVIIPRLEALYQQ
jgi:sugar transferase (PEP-CTERM/EpsH1 system associated)